MDKPIMKIIDNQLDIKLGWFTEGELDVVLTKIKNRKAAGLSEIPPEVWKTRKFDDILLQYYNTIYNQNTRDRWTNGCILPFPKKGDLKIAKNYWGITLTPKAAKIYNALLVNPIKPEIEKILKKNQNGFCRNQLDNITNSDNLLNFRCLCKKPQSYIPICTFLQDIWHHTQREDRANTSSLRSTQGDHCSHHDAL